MKSGINKANFRLINKKESLGESLFRDGHLIDEVKGELRDRLSFRLLRATARTALIINRQLMEDSELEPTDKMVIPWFAT